MAKGNFLTRRFGGGVNLMVSPRDLEAKDGIAELALARNIYRREINGRLAFRPPLALLGFTVVGGGVNNKLSAALLQLDDVNAGHWLLQWDELFNRLAILFPGDGTHSPTYIPLVTTTCHRRPAWFQWQNKLYVLFGFDDIGPGYVVEPDGAGSLQTSSIGASWGSDQPRASVAWMYRNTLMLANLGPADLSTVRNCAVNDPTTLVSATKSWYVQRGDGDEITAAIEVAVIGGAVYVEPYSVIWKRNSTWMLQGVPPTGATDGSLQLTPLNRYEGCVAKETVVKTPYGIVWCSGKNVWLLPYGGTPKPIGNKIRTLLQSLPAGAPAAWHASYLNGYYRLTIPATDPVTSDAVPGSTINRPTEEWWCDLRELDADGNPVSWWGPMSSGAVAQLVERISPGQDRLLVMREPQVDMFSSQFQFLEMSQSNTVYSFGDLGDTATLLPHTYEMRFKEYDLGDPMINKLWDVVELSLYTPIGGSIFLDMLTEGSNGNLPGGDGAGHDYLTTTPPGFVLGFIKVTVDALALSHPLGTYAMYPGSRLMAKSWQPVVRSQSPFELEALGVRLRPIGRRPS